jgi:hypothetical protein
MDWALYGLACGMTLGFVLVALALPRLPMASFLVGALPVGYFLIVALLRHATLGTTSGFVALVVLPVAVYHLQVERRPRFRRGRR